MSTETSTDAANPGHSSSRVERRRDRRKAEIVATATRVLASDGYQGMSLEDVAERTDIAKATLYHYFTSKDELVAAALEFLTQEVLRRLGEREQLVGRDTPADELLAALIDEQILIITETAPEVATVFSWPHAWPEAFDSMLKDMRRRHDAVFRKIVERGLREGVFTVQHVDVSLQGLHGIINQSSVWLRPDVHDDDRAEVRGHSLSVLVGEPGVPGRGQREGGWQLSCLLVVDVRVGDPNARWPVGHREGGDAQTLDGRVVEAVVEVDLAVEHVDLLVQGHAAEQGPGPSFGRARVGPPIVVGTCRSLQPVGRSGLCGLGRDGRRGARSERGCGEEPHGQA
ncbi:MULTISPECIES: TetR/AcrR family transcriptional regulator [unclassified Aeromicrobium]|uniref:TetR/AcrR family transcriptional regulator n=1 Tax=unclassified Aeromicrobium TaxID=2633570 RepID=UPI00396B01BF